MDKQEKTTVKSEIKKAFMQLLLQKAYMDITVSDVVNKAHVARMSFYRNFESLDDVIESVADDMIHGFKTDIAPVLAENNERKWRDLLFEIIYRVIRIQKESGVSLQELAKTHSQHNIIISRVQERILSMESELPIYTAAEKYAVIGKLNLIHGILGKWALTGMQESPEEIVNVIMSIIMKF